VIVFDHLDFGQRVCDHQLGSTLGTKFTHILDAAVNFGLCRTGHQKPLISVTSGRARPLRSVLSTHSSSLNMA